MRLFLGWLGYLALLCATGAMAGSYAYATGETHGPGWAYIFAAAVAALLAAESALASGKGRCPGWLRFPALLVTAAAVLSMEVGFAASVFTDARATRAEAHRDAAISATIADAALHAEPVAVVRIELEAIEGRNRGVNATWCRAKDEAARTVCEAWVKVRTRLAKAEAAEASATVRTDAKPTGDVDARSALLSRTVGGHQTVWADALVLLLAVAMSAARVACAAMLMGDRPSVAHVAAVSPVATPAPEPEPEPELVEPSRVVPFPAKTTEAVAELSGTARAVLREIAGAARPAEPGQGYVGFVPPGALSQRSLAASLDTSRRHVAEALATLASAGVVEAVPLGREGTAYRLLQPVEALTA